MKKIISVTKNDIRGGQRRDCRACMLGLAVGRRVRRGSVIVLNGIDCDEEPTAYLADKLGDKLANLHPKARFAEFRFERGQKVKPFRFVLDLPAKYWKR